MHLNCSIPYHSPAHSSTHSHYQVNPILSKQSIMSSHSHGYHPQSPAENQNISPINSFSQSHHLSQEVQTISTPTHHLTQAINESSLSPSFPALLPTSSSFNVNSRKRIAIASSTPTQSAVLETYFILNSESNTRICCNSLENPSKCFSRQTSFSANTSTQIAMAHAAKCFNLSQEARAKRWLYSTKATDKELLDWIIKDAVSICLIFLSIPQPYIL